MSSPPFLKICFLILTIAIGDAQFHALCANTASDPLSQSPFAADFYVVPLHEDTTFTEADISLPGVYSGNAVWFDFDNDSDLDILISGLLTDEENYISKIFRNDSGLFIDINAPLTAVGSEDGVAWGDYDNDGDWDVAIAGRTDEASTQPVSKIYRNDNGLFVNINAGLIGLNGGSVSWCDFDNDCDLDLFVCGSPDLGLTFASKIYRNTNGSFTDANVGLPGVWGSSVGWADYDNDGDADLMMTGYGELGVTAILLNNQNGNFQNSGISFEAVNSGGLEWADYDNDGDLDLAVSGAISGGASSRIYRNDNGSFTNIGAPIQPLAVSALTWGDFDNDGRTDLVITGTDNFSGNNPKTRLYRNEGGGVFAVQNSQFPGTWFGSLAWGDYDRDGDLDLLMTGGTSGTSPYNPITRLFRNNTSEKNTPPSAPSTIGETHFSNSVTLQWHRSFDSQSSSHGLSYNLQIGTTPQTGDILTSNSIPTTGLRRTPRIGNAQADTHWTIKNLPPGKYYWRVQSIDNGYVGSEFAETDSFIVTSTGIESDIPIPPFFRLGQNYPNPFNSVTTIEYFIPERTFVRLHVFDLLGRKVTTLVERIEEAGLRNVKFDASFLPSGVYWYRLEAGPVQQSNTMMLLR